MYPPVNTNARCPLFTGLRCPVCNDFSSAENTPVRPPGHDVGEGPTAVDPELPERSGHRKPHGCPKEKESLPPRKRDPHPAALPAGINPSNGICINIKKLFTFAAIVL